MRYGFSKGVYLAHYNDDLEARRILRRVPVHQVGNDGIVRHAKGIVERVVGFMWLIWRSVGIRKSLYA